MADVTNGSNLPQTKGLIGRILDTIEWAGNKLPDPAVLFLAALFITWFVSWPLSDVQFTEIDPRSKQPIEIKNQLTGEAITQFLVDMVETFTGFHPLGVVLVALLGVGVAEHTGFINACLKAMLSLTPKLLLSPMLLLVAVISSTSGDTGYVLVIPLGGIMFAAAGRHPVAGIACAFAGVSGGFSANFIPSGLDPLLQELTEAGAHLIDPEKVVNPLCNWYFMSASCLIIVAVGWYITDKLVEPRLSNLPVDGDPEDVPHLGEMTSREVKGMIGGLVTLVLGLGILALICMPEDSPLRNKEGSLTMEGAALMDILVPLIFLLFLIPAVVHGYIAGTVKTHRDVIKGMSKSMSTMGYYLVLAFFASLFIYSFGKSNLGALLALKGAAFLESMGLADQITIIGIIFLAGFVNLIVGSASAKWALLAPIFVPMLMQVGLAPELTQAAYRIGDSCTNILTPLMPYFPLIVVYAQRYVKNTGIGTLISLMIPYSIAFLVVWSVLLLIFWGFGLPMGIPTEIGYNYP